MTKLIILWKNERKHKPLKERAKEALHQYCCECVMVFDTKDFEFVCTIDYDLEHKAYWFQIYFKQDDYEMYCSPDIYNSIEETITHAKEFINENFVLWDASEEF